MVLCREANYKFMRYRFNEKIISTETWIIHTGANIRQFTCKMKNSFWMKVLPYSSKGCLCCTTAHDERNLHSDIYIYSDIYIVTVSRKWIENQSPSYPLSFYVGQEWGHHGYPRIIYNYVAVGCAGTWLVATCMWDRLILYFLSILGTGIRIRVLLYHVHWNRNI